MTGLIAWIALVAALAAAGYAWKLSQELGTARRRSGSLQSLFV